MKSIKINAIQLANLVKNNHDLFGSTDWDIYVNDEGTLDIRHNTHSTEGWYMFSDLYNWWTDDPFDGPIEDYADWLKSDGIDLYQIEERINEDLFEFELDENGNATDVSEKVSLEWE